jgi:hypothetical protein
VSRAFWFEGAVSGFQPFHFSEAIEKSLLAKAFARGKTLVKYEPSGKTEATWDTMVGSLYNLGFWLAQHNDLDHRFLFVHEHGALEFCGEQTKPFEITTYDEDLLLQTKLLIDAWVKISNEALFILKSEHGDLEFSPMEDLGRELQKKNYSTKVITAFEHIVTDLESLDPCGRIGILSGQPGTGKTNLVRALLSRTTRARHVLVPPELVPHITEPANFSVLEDFKRRYGQDRPIVFIVEDADVCLVPRQSDNISHVSAVLNLSDGLIGANLDIRLIATTNARKLEMDPAILRPGRLCRHVEVGALTAAEANAALANLLPVGVEPIPFNGPTTIAEVYAAARSTKEGKEQSKCNQETSSIGYRGTSS